METGQAYAAPSVVDIIGIYLSVYRFQNVILFFDEALGHLNHVLERLTSMVISGLLHLAIVLIAF